LGSKVEGNNAARKTDMPAGLTELDGMRIEEMYRLAFRYYKMIINGESPLDIDRFTISRKAKPGPDDVIELYRCIGCSNPLSEADISGRMPVCEACRKRIRVDFEILRELFH
jgi:hypothetical protein